MGNQPSVHDSSAHHAQQQQQQVQVQSRPPLRNLFRHSNALGLSKTELDEFCKPSGLYSSCQWEEKAIRRLIGDGKLAARLRGTEHRRAEGDRECPICFLNYSSVNVTKCCQANICTECYLQVRPQKEKSSTCPFCNTNKLAVAVAKPLDEVAIKQREEEEQRVLEARIRQRTATFDSTNSTTNSTHHASTTTTTTSTAAADMERAPESLTTTTTTTTNTTTAVPPGSSGFGSSLEQNEHVARLRARTSSLASSQEGSEEDIALLAMTPEERRELEAEMRAQHFHPVAMRIEQEEAERRLRNQRDYYQTQAGRLRELRARREMLYHRLGGVGTSTTSTSTTSTTTNADVHRHSRTDPIPEEESLPRARTGRDWNRIVDAFESQGAGTINSLDDLVVLEAAIMLSMEEEARRRELAGEPSDNENATTTSRATAAEDMSFASTTTTTTTTSGENMALLMQNLRQRSLRSRHGGGGSGGRLLSSMVGLTEEEQIAMAIAASLQDQAGTTSSNSEQQSAPASSSANPPPPLDAANDTATDAQEEEKEEEEQQQQQKDPSRRHQEEHANHSRGNQETGDEEYLDATC